jgi:histidinol dehydrogenase
MRISRFDWDGNDARGLAAELRALQPPLAEVADDVAAIIADVAERGDDAVLEAEERFGAGRPDSLVVAADELDAARSQIDDEVAAALETAAANVVRVAEAEAMADLRVTLPQGQAVRLRSVAVPSAGAYVPGGKAAYPSTALMCCLWHRRRAPTERLPQSFSPPAQSPAPTRSTRWEGSRQSPQWRWARTPSSPQM